MRLIEYVATDGRSPFARWFAALEPAVAAKITVSLSRLAAGNTSNVKGVGEGVLEQKVDFGPGYRVYFGRDGKTMIILLGGGTKQRQQRDIADAIDRWREYRSRRREQ
jgi:putative addiction module killer protein